MCEKKPGGEILVSITSLAYNQEKYVRRTLEGFVSQKTDFTFEILIHDDASTDQTAKIIREYEEKYPDLMRPVYQTENQYSKGVKVGVELRRRARGKYIAFCEGDDYWTDPEKLQRQVDYMEAHPECSLCVHATRIIDEAGNPTGQVFRPFDHDCDFGANEVILSGGGMFQTNSMLARRDLMDEYPPFYYHCPVGDYPLQIYMGMRGKIHYMDRFMSAYRQQSNGSWSQKTHSSVERIAKHCLEMCRLLEEVAEYDGAYTDSCRKRIDLFHIQVALLTGDRKTIRELRGKVDRSRLSRAMRIGIRLPGLYRWLRMRKARKLLKAQERSAGKRG